MMMMTQNARTRDERASVLLPFLIRLHSSPPYLPFPAASLKFPSQS